MSQFILGSQSPRRSELLKQVGYKFDIIKPDVEEIIPQHIPPTEAAAYLSRLKAENIIPLTDQVVITADTLVICNDKIFGKPNNLDEAKEMLQQLSGNIHHVITGICIGNKTEKVSTSTSVSVHFKALTDQEIEFYLNNYVVLDKAGAYAIQEWIGMIGIEKIDGDYYAVMGLPIQEVYSILFNTFNIQPFD